MKPTEARKLLARLAAAYPRAAIELPTVEVYVEALRDLTVAEAELAVDRLIRTSSFFPSIAEIRGIVADVRLAIPTAEEAWGEVRARQTYRRNPEYRECPNCDGTGDDAGVVCELCNGEGRRQLPGPKLHDLTQRSLDSLGGFAALADTEEPGIFRAQFLKTYAGLRTEALRDEAIGQAA